MRRTLANEVGEELIQFVLVLARPDIEGVNHHVLVVVLLDILIVHAQANLAEIQVLARELESMQELLLVRGEVVLVFVFDGNGNAELVLELLH